MIDCDNIFCIYQEEGKCVADDVSINDIGMCADCIYISIEEKELARRKEQLRKEIERRWND